MRRSRVFLPLLKYQKRQYCFWIAERQQLIEDEKEFLELDLFSPQTAFCFCGNWTFSVGFIFSKLEALVPFKITHILFWPHLARNLSYSYLGPIDFYGGSLKFPNTVSLEWVSYRRTKGEELAEGPGCCVDK